MSEIENLSKFIEDYPEAVNNARTSRSWSIQTLADRAGVSKSSVSRLIDRTQADPKLYVSAAICKTLGLSLDKLFGLQPPPDDAAALMERAGSAELEAQRLHGECNLLQSELAHQKESAAMLRQQLNSRRPVIYTLLCACTVMAFTLLIYIFLDASIPDAGFIRGANIRAAAWIVIAMIFASLGIIAWAIITTVRKPKKRTEEKS